MIHQDVERSPGLAGHRASSRSGHSVLEAPTTCCQCLVGASPRPGRQRGVGGPHEVGGRAQPPAGVAATVQAMAAREKRTNTRTGSTTWVWDPDRVRRSRREGQRVSKTPNRWYGLSRRNPKDKLTLTVTYRGGAECWYLIEGRGRSGVFPGVVCIHDAMREIYGIRDTSDE